MEPLRIVFWGPGLSGTHQSVYAVKCLLEDRPVTQYLDRGWQDFEDDDVDPRWNATRVRVSRDVVRARHPTVARDLFLIPRASSNSGWAATQLHSFRDAAAVVLVLDPRRAEEVNAHALTELEAALAYHGRRIPFPRVDPHRFERESAAPEREARHSAVVPRWAASLFSVFGRGPPSPLPEGAWSSAFAVADSKLGAQVGSLQAVPLVVQINWTDVAVGWNREALLQALGFVEVPRAFPTVALTGMGILDAFDALASRLRLDEK